MNPFHVNKLENISRVRSQYHYKICFRSSNRENILQDTEKWDQDFANEKRLFILVILQD